MRKVYEQVKMAIDDVQYVQEKLKRKDDPSDSAAAGKVPLPAETLALAGMTDLLSGDLRRKYADLVTIPYLPQMRPPVPLSHISRPNKLPGSEGGAAASGK